MNQPRILAEITFLSASEGGRKSPPTNNVSDGAYRPHLVVGDPNQRKALIVDNVIQETYLGVTLVGGSSKVVADEPFLAELELLYWPNVSYESLIPDATFTIREGPHVVGYGKVKSISMNGAT